MTLYVYKRAAMTLASETSWRHLVHVPYTDCTAVLVSCLLLAVFLRDLTYVLKMGRHVPPNRALAFRGRH
jgi:hypothetical protein